MFLKLNKVIRKKSYNNYEKKKCNGTNYRKLRYKYTVVKIRTYYNVLRMNYMV